MTAPPQLPEDIADPSKLSNLLPLLLVGVFFVVVAAIIIWVVYRAITKEAAVMPKEARLDPPRPEALKRLQRLEGQLQEMDSRALAQEITETIKRFLERQYGVDLKSHTTDEYYDAVNQGGSGVPNELAQGLANLFSYLDALKFQLPEESGSHKEQILEQAVAIVQAEVQPQPQTAVG